METVLDDTADLVVDLLLHITKNINEFVLFIYPNDAGAGTPIPTGTWFDKDRDVYCVTEATESLPTSTCMLGIDQQILDELTSLDLFSPLQTRFFKTSRSQGLYLFLTNCEKHIVSHAFVGPYGCCLPRRGLSIKLNFRRLLTTMDK